MNIKKALILCTAVFCTLAGSMGQTAPITYSGTPFKVNLVWQANTDKPANDLTQLPSVEGVNIVSPCWFSIIDKNGQIKAKASPEDAAKLRAKGYKVWALIDNSFDHTLTHNLLNNEKARNNVIRNMVTYADEYKLDGYNLDFENIHDTDKTKLTQFVQDIANALREKKVTLSMDITVPSNEPYWSKCFDRQALGNICDYIMVMTYDQYHPAMHKAGSTAALNWVDTKVQETLQYIPAKKLVLGLPFYARLWSTKDGKTKGKTIQMEAMENLIIAHNIQPIWLPELGQYYLTYKQGNTTYEVWQEDKYSLQEKVNLVEKYKLAGIASWRKGFETSDIWPILHDALAGRKRVQN